MEFSANDRALTAREFLALAARVWPGDYDPVRTEAALARTQNITARDGGALVGCLRILTDGCFFRHHPRNSGASGIPAAGGGQPPAGPGPGQHAHAAVLRRAAGSLCLLREKRLCAQPARLRAAALPVTF